MDTQPSAHLGQYTPANLDDGSDSPATGRLELNLIVSGAATYTIEGSSFRAGTRSLIWMFPEQEHRRSEISDDFAAWFVQFDPESVAQLCRSSSNQILTEQNPDGVFCRKLSKVGTKRLQSHWEALASPGLDCAHLNAGFAYLLLSAWSEYQKAADAREAAGLHPAVEKAARILRAQPETGSLNQLAKTCGASASWLSRLFRQQMSISLVEFRNHCRIERFFELYRSGPHRNIAQTAAEAGFGSYAQFHRVFRKKVGYGPAELRRRMHDEPVLEARQSPPLLTTA